MNRPSPLVALRLRVAILAACEMLGGCAGHGEPAVDAAAHGQWQLARQHYEGLGTADASTLREIASGLLWNAAQAEDSGRSRAAFSQLAFGGTRAVPLLHRLVFEGRAEAVKVRALSRLAALGDDAAGASMRVLARKHGGETLQMAVRYLDLKEDLAWLQGLTRDPKPALRAAAARRLGDASPTAEAMRLLRSLARRDPDAAVRAAALGALAELAASAAGAAASGGVAAAAVGSDGLLLEIVVTSLSDPELAVRLAAARTLVALPGTAAAVALQSLVGGDPSPPAIEAARLSLVAARASAAQVEVAHGQLLRALTATATEIRAQAAVAWASSPAPLRPTERLVAALEDERAPSVALQLALALGAAHPQGTARLRELMVAETMDGVTAASELAAAGDADARARLHALGKSKTAALRVAVARASVRRLGYVHSARAFLFDDDAQVRLATAGALLSTD